jgi:hypothetical protein
VFKFIALILLSLLSGLAVAKADLKSYLYQKMNPKIVKAFEATTRRELEAVLGKPTLVEKNLIHYELEGFKYALSAKLNAEMIVSTFYHPRIIKISAIDLKNNNLIDSSKVKDLKKNGQIDGLFKEYIDESTKLRIVFKNGSDYSISTIEVLK